MSKTKTDDGTDSRAGKSRIKRNLISFAFLILLLILTLWMILKDNDIVEIWNSVLTLEPVWSAFAVFAALFFVSAEGFMIWYILRSLKCGISLPNCIGYSFVGFFFSGITPSASGGQPMQLYYMSKDKIKIADSTVTLTIVATFYKFILVLIGIVVAIFWGNLLTKYLSGYIYLFYFGLILNSVVVAVLIMLMAKPNVIKKILLKCERLIVRMRILKPSINRSRKLANIAYEYNRAVKKFVKNPKPIIVTTIVTILQRCSIFFITYFIYRGMGLNAENIVVITVLQASVYVAVDLLPLPGAQGISELMYQTVFGTIFTGAYLPASVLITRGVSFYLPLIVGIAVTVVFWLKKSRTKKITEQ